MTSHTFAAGILGLIVLGLMCIPAAAYSPNATAFYTSGVSLTASGNFTEALAAFKNAIDADPSYFEAWDGMADVLNREKHYPEALTASNQALALNASDVKGWIIRGQILYNSGYVYEDTLHDTAKADVLYNEQLLAFDNATRIDPNSTEAWFNKGFALAGLKRYDEAIAAFDRVAAIDPTYPKLAANRNIAVQLRDASTPNYGKYALPAGVIAVAIIGIGVLAYLNRKTE